MEEVAAQPNPVQPISPEESKPKSGMSKKTLLLIIILFLIAFGLVGLALYLNNNQNQKAPEQAQQVTPTPDPVQTVLTISSTPTPLSTPSAYKTDVVINTGQNSVTQAQLELSYDPKVLTKVDINPGSFFPDSEVTIKTIDKVNGRISFVISVPNQQGVKNGVLGQGILANINFSVLPGQKSIPISINFLPKTEVSAENIAISVLKSSIDAKFVLDSFKPTFTPAPTPTPTSTF